MALLDLWLPILLSAVAVFIASAIMHMVLPFHRKDYKKLEHEDDIRQVIRKAGPAPGQYILPFAVTPKESATPEMVAKYEEGPVAIMNVYPNGPMKMGKTLGMWFVLCLIISDFCAYVATLGAAPGTEYLTVFRIVGAVAFAGYALAEPANSIWRGQPWSNTFRSLVDGLVFALLTAGIFGWLWPAA